MKRLDQRKSFGFKVARFIAVLLLFIAGTVVMSKIYSEDRSKKISIEESLFEPYKLDGSLNEIGLVLEKKEINRDDDLCVFKVKVKRQDYIALGAIGRCNNKDVGEEVQLNVLYFFNHTRDVFWARFAFAK